MLNRCQIDPCGGGGRGGFEGGVWGPVPNKLVRGLLGTDPPDPTLESARPPLLRGQFGIDSTSIRRRFDINFLI